MSDKRARSTKGGHRAPTTLPCPRCGKDASAAHFKRNKACAAYVARLRAMLNVSQRRRVVAGPGRPRKGATTAPGAAPNVQAGAWRVEGATE